MFLFPCPALCCCAVLARESRWLMLLLCDGHAMVLGCGMGWPSLLGCE